jgi:hypothetical protein
MRCACGALAGALRLGDGSCLRDAVALRVVADRVDASGLRGALAVLAARVLLDFEALVAKVAFPWSSRGCNAGALERDARGQVNTPFVRRRATDRERLDPR